MSSIKYVKKKQRKKSTSKSKFGVRLHGAFQGGFSAGHFNTVGSEKGWKPSDAEGIEGEEDFDGENEHEHGQGNEQGNKHEHLSKKKRKRRLLIQRPEDFMDEEDANEWGGPTKVKQAYQRNGDNANNDNAANANANTNTNSIISDTNDTIHSSIHDSSSLRKLLYINKDNNNHNNNNNNGESLSVGKQLLKVLGWREKRNSDGTTLSYAYIPMDDDGTGMSRKHSNGEKEEKGNSSLLLLSTKRLKRIEMQINNASSLSKSKSKSSNSSTSTSTESLGYVIKIPPPKIDTYGMGYEPYKNAPEFKAHREMRRLRAEKRARAASSTHGSNRMNVYNMDDLNDDNDNEYAYGNGSDGRNINIKSKTQLPHQQQQSNNETQGDILAYETTEDFIGTKTVGGFALNDDDDQVYDNTAGQSASLFNKGSIAFPGTSTSTSTGTNTNTHAKSKINLNEYANEAYDGSDSDVEGGGGYFLHDDTSIYGTHATMKKKTYNNTNIGRKKVAQGTNNQQMQSFAGALSAWAFEGDVESKNGTITSTKKTQPVTSDGEAPLAGFTLGGSNDNTMKRYPGPDVPADYQVKRHEFSHLDAIATIKLSSLMKRDMKSKRTHTMTRTGAGNAVGASISNHINDRNNMQPIAGKSFASLSHALKNRFTSSAGTTSEQDANSRNKSNLDPRKVKITRTTISWQPSNLLLKRFNINTGHHHTNKSSTSQQGKQDLSLSETKEEAFFRNDVLGQLETLNSTSAGTKKSDALSFDKRGLSADKTTIERPSLDLMKSIFEPFSEDEDVNDYDDDSDDDGNVVDGNVVDGNVVDTIEDFTQENDVSVEKLDIKVQQNEPSEFNNNEADEVSSQASDSSSSRRQRKKRRKRSSSRRRDKKRKKHKSKKKWKD